MSLFKELYNYREMVFMLVRRDLRGRYQASVLGFLWTFINPLLQLTVYAVVFAILLPSDIENYYIFLFVAFIPWHFLASSIPVGAMCIPSQANLVQKIYFPRIILPISVTLTGFTNMLLSELVVFAVLILSGMGLSIYLVALPVVMIVQLLFVMGFVLILSALTVYFRDLAHIMDIVMMAWFYSTPVVYAPEMIADKVPLMLTLNPMAGIISCYRDILYYQRFPQLSSLTTAIIFGLVTIVFGTFIFQRLQRGFAEEL